MVAGSGNQLEDFLHFNDIAYYSSLRASLLTVNNYRRMREIIQGMSHD